MHRHTQIDIGRHQILKNSYLFIEKSFFAYPKWKRVMIEEMKGVAKNET